MSITIRSDAFTNGGAIPSMYTCDGQDISPSLQWENIPQGAITLALISDDPDAPVGTWVHWVIFNIPAGARELPRDIPPRKVLADGSIQGLNDFGKIGYGGPCPPGGTHRYFFKLYALDCRLDLSPVATKKMVVDAMDGHVIDRGELMGTYTRQRKIR